MTSIRIRTQRNLPASVMQVAKVCNIIKQVRGYVEIENDGM